MYADLTSALILSGDFNTAVRSLDTQLSSWEQLGATVPPPFVVKKMSFLLVDDCTLRDEKAIAKGWRDKLSLRATWRDDLKKLCASKFYDQIDEIGKEEQDPCNTYGELKKIVESQSW